MCVDRYVEIYVQFIFFVCFISFKTAIFVTFLLYYFVLIHMLFFCFIYVV